VRDFEKESVSFEIHAEEGREIVRCKTKGVAAAARPTETSVSARSIRRVRLQVGQPRSGIMQPQAKSASALADEARFEFSAPLLLGRRPASSRSAGSP
jgi:hypothetical protein